MHLCPSFSTCGEVPLPPQTTNNTLSSLQDMLLVSHPDNVIDSKSSLPPCTVMATQLLDYNNPECIINWIDHPCPPVSISGEVQLCSPISTCGTCCSVMANQLLDYNNPECIINWIDHPSQAHSHDLPVDFSQIKLLRPSASHSAQDHFKSPSVLAPCHKTTYVCPTIAL